MSDPRDSKSCKYRQEIGQMMYVSGETGEPSAETTGLIEEIVRQQVIELLRTSTELAARRGSRAITINDLIFQIRHDQAKVSRLRTFLSWKDVRKNVRESDDKVGDADLGAAAGGDDPMGGGGAGGVGGGAPASIDGPDGAKKNRKAKVGLPWEPASFYGHDIPDRMGGGGGDDDGGDDDGDEEEMNYITLQRLRKADERTRDMTRDEYVTWSEYRQASFTYRKAKRFREWAGFGVVTDSKPSDDIIDILGFLTFEMVQTLTETALRIKEQEDTWRGAAATAAAAAAAADNKVGRKKPHQIMSTLFSASPSSAKAPIEPRHIQEAYRRLQRRDRKYGAMLNGTMLPQNTPLRIF